MVPPRPDSSQNDGAKKKGQESRLVERIDKFIQQLETKREENKKKEERQRQQLEDERWEYKKEIKRQNYKIINKNVNL